MDLKINYCRILKSVGLLCWILTIFIYYFQVPFKELSSYLVYVLGAYIIININSIKANISKSSYLWLYIYILFMIILAISLATSIVSGVAFNNSVRFMFILLSIPLCVFLKQRNFEIEYRIFMLLSIAKCIFIIIIAIMVFYIGDYTVFRIWAQTNGYGDIYFLYDNIPKVQLHGNSILCFAFMLNYIKNKKFTPTGVFILLGTLIAGNFAYILGIVIFAMYIVARNTSFSKMTLTKIMSFFLGIFLLIGFYSYAEKQAELKENYSNALREQQITILLDFDNIVFGEGLGCTVPDNSKIARSADATYYEMQSIYILRQIGIAGLFVFYVLLFWPILKFWGKPELTIYSIYLVYSFFNPECFDTTQIVVTILGVNIRNLDVDRYSNVISKI